MFFSRENNDNETVVSLIASAIRRDISFGELAPDTKLKIAELKNRYGGSTHSLREALTLLSTQGLVEASAQRGFRVASATQDDLKDITRVRLEIEKLGLDWSLKNGGVKWEGEVIASHHALSRAQDYVMQSPIDGALEWDESNRLFHVCLMSASGSPRIMDIQAQLYDQSRRFILAALREQQLNLTLISDNHNRLVEAVLARDSDVALQCLQQDIEISLPYSINTTNHMAH